MRINDVKTYVLGTAWRNLTYVELHTDQGLVGGYFGLPSGPGLGVVLDHAVVERHPRRQISFNLFAENWHRRQAEREPVPSATRE